MWKADFAEHTAVIGVITLWNGRSLILLATALIQTDTQLLLLLLLPRPVLSLGRYAASHRSAA
jgi:hypothetical protein